MQTANWPEIIDQIRAASHSYQSISLKTGIPVTTIYNAARMDAEPAWSDGEQIITLWLSVTQSGPEAIPMRQYVRASRLFRKQNGRK